MDECLVIFELYRFDYAERSEWVHEVGCVLSWCGVRGQF